MKAFLLLLFFILTNIYASQNIWTQNTNAMSDEKAQQIINSYIENNATHSIVFEDDVDSKETFDFKENIFMIGAEIGAAYNSEKVYNLSGEKTDTFSSVNIKLIVGKDFTLWHEEYTQPSRLYMAFDSVYLNEDVQYTTFMLGLKENMFYWSIYKDESLNIYPTLNFELGSSSITRDTLSSSGFTTEFGLGVAMVVDDNFEYFLNFNARSIEWDHPIDGIADEMSSYSLSIGLNYKIMYGDI